MRNGPNKSHATHHVWFPKRHPNQLAQLGHVSKPFWFRHFTEVQEQLKKRHSFLVQSIDLWRHDPIINIQCRFLVRKRQQTRSVIVTVIVLVTAAVLAEAAMTMTLGCSSKRKRLRRRWRRLLRCVANLSSSASKMIISCNRLIGRIYINRQTINWNRLRQ